MEIKLAKDRDCQYGGLEAHQVVLCMENNCSEVKIFFYSRLFKTWIAVGPSRKNTTPSICKISFVVSRYGGKINKKKTFIWRTDLDRFLFRVYGFVEGPGVGGVLLVEHLLNDLMAGLECLRLTTLHKAMIWNKLEWKGDLGATSKEVLVIPLFVFTFRSQQNT